MAEKEKDVNRKNAKRKTMLVRPGGVTVVGVDKNKPKTQVNSNA